MSPSGAAYAFKDEIGCFLQPVNEGEGNALTREFYDEGGGWAVDETGLYEETRRFVDTRPTSLRFTRACIRRLGKYFRRGGEYLLDAGCGPIAHNELLDYGDRFEKRICLDLSVSALREAKRKLGSRGVYLQGDLTNLPIKSNVIDAAMSFHVIYQLPTELQSQAFKELWRVLKPGGVAVVPYWWAFSTLPWKIRRVSDFVLGQQVAPGSAFAQPPNAKVPDHNPLTRRWFEAQTWPFEYSYDVYRAVGNGFLRECIPDDWRGATFLGLLMALQRAAPGYCGKHGRMPAIVIRKTSPSEPG